MITLTEWVPYKANLLTSLCLKIDQFERSHALDAHHYTGLPFHELDLQRVRVHFVHIKRRI